MLNCSSCGARVSRRDVSCSYCRATNAAYAPLAAKHAALLARGMEAHQQGRHADAVEALAAVIEEEPESFHAYFYLASAWSSLGNNDYALRAMQDASTIQPGNIALHYNLAVLLDRGHRRSEAIAEIEEAVRLADRDPTCPGDLRARVHDERKRLTSR